MVNLAVGDKEDGCPDTLRDSDGIDVGTPVLVGVMLGWLDDWAETEGFADGCILFGPMLAGVGRGCSIGALVGCLPSTGAASCTCVGR